LQGCPQKKGVCVRVFTAKPKKPNSAVRAAASFHFCSLIGREGKVACFLAFLRFRTAFPAHLRSPPFISLAHLWSFDS
jgi:hypothetical protein